MLLEEAFIIRIFFLLTKVFRKHGGMAYNGLHIYEVAAFENRCFCLALNFL